MFSNTTKAVSAAAAIVLAGLAANAAVIVPAEFVAGVVTAVNRDTGVFQIDDKTYTVKPTRLLAVQPGHAVTLDLIDGAGNPKVLAITVPEMEPAGDK